MRKNDWIIMSDTYYDIWAYIENRLYSDYRWADPDFYDFESAVTAEEVIEEFSGFGFTNDEIRYAYEVIEDIFMSDKERTYSNDVMKKMDDEIKQMAMKREEESLY